MRVVAAEATPLAGAIQGRAPEVYTAPSAKLRMDPAHNFVFLANPACWDIALTKTGPAVVPRLRQFSFEPGLAGVEPVKGRWDGDPTRALTELGRKGWTPIRRDRPIMAHGRSLTDYAMVYDGHKGPVHLPVWSQPFVRGGEVVIDFDEDGWHEFLVGLLRDGTVAPPDRQLVRALDLSFRQAWRGYQSSAGRSAYAADIAEVYEAKIGAFKLIAGGKAAKAPKDSAPRGSDPANFVSSTPPPSED